MYYNCPTFIDNQFNKSQRPFFFSTINFSSQGFRVCISLVLFILSYTHLSYTHLQAQSSWKNGLNMIQPEIDFTAVIRNGNAMLLHRGSVVEIFSFKNNTASVLRNVRQNGTICGLYNDTTLLIFQSPTLDFVSTESGRTLKTLSIPLTVSYYGINDIPRPLVKAVGADNIIYSTPDSIYCISSTSGQIICRERYYLQPQPKLLNYYSPCIYITSAEPNRIWYKRLDALNEPPSSLKIIYKSFCPVDSLIVIETDDSISAYNVISNKFVGNYSKNGNDVLSILPVFQSGNQPPMIALNYQGKDQSVILNLKNFSIESKLPHSSGNGVYSVVFDNVSKQWWVGNYVGYNGCTFDMPRQKFRPDCYAVTQQDGSLIRRYPEGHITKLKRAEFSNDGTRFMTSSGNPYHNYNDDNYLWRRSDTSLIRKVSGRFLGFAKNGSLYVIHRNDSILVVRNDSVEWLLATIPSPALTYVGCSITTDYIAIAFHKTMILHKLRNGESDIFLPNQVPSGDSIISINISSNSQQLSALTHNGILYEFARDTMVVVSSRTVEPPRKAWYNGERALWSGNGERVLINNALYSVKSGDLLFRIKNNKASDYTTAQLSYDGNYIFYGTREPYMSMAAQQVIYRIADSTEVCVGFDSYSESSACPAEALIWVSGDANNFIGCEKYKGIAYLKTMCQDVLVSVVDDQQFINSLIVFPQPASATLNVSVGGSLIDMLGCTHLSVAEKGVVDVSHLPPGVYVYHTNTGESRAVCIHR